MRVDQRPAGEIEQPSTVRRGGGTSIELAESLAIMEHTEEGLIDK